MNNLSIITNTNLSHLYHHFLPFIFSKCFSSFDVNTQHTLSDAKMERDLKQKLLRKPEEENEEETLGKRVWNETKLMWIVAAPAIFTRFSTFGIQVISQAFVGHIGSKELAAFALVFTVLIRFANGILVSSVLFSC